MTKPNLPLHPEKVHCMLLTSVRHLGQEYARGTVMEYIGPGQYVESDVVLRQPLGGTLSISRERVAFVTVQLRDDKAKTEEFAAAFGLRKIENPHMAELERVLGLRFPEHLCELIRYHVDRPPGQVQWHDFHTRTWAWRINGVWSTPLDLLPPHVRSKACAEDSKAWETFRESWFAIPNDRETVNSVLDHIWPPAQPEENPQLAKLEELTQNLIEVVKEIKCRS